MPSVRPHCYVGPVRPTCTHVALEAADVDRSVAFYRTHVGLEPIHRRREHDTDVVWLGEPERPDALVIVLIETPQAASKPHPMAHLGYAVESRAKVDEAAARGRAAGVEVSGPVDAGGVVGYYCLLADPDGNWIEFSFGQSLGEQP